MSRCWFEPVIIELVCCCNNSAEVLSVYVTEYEGANMNRFRTCLLLFTLRPHTSCIIIIGYINIDIYEQKYTPIHYKPGALTDIG